MLDIPKAIEAIGDAFKSAADYAKTAKKRQSETEIIKEKRQLKKAANTAEKIFRIFLKYIDKLSEEDREKVEDLLNDFDKDD